MTTTNPTQTLKSIALLFILAFGFTSSVTAQADPGDKAEG
jgi:hypothetical protein